MSPKLCTRWQYIICISTLLMNGLCLMNRQTRQDERLYVQDGVRTTGVILSCKEDGRLHRASERYGSHLQVWSYLSLLGIPFQTTNISSTHFFYLDADPSATSPRATIHANALHTVVYAFRNTRVSNNSLVRQSEYFDRYLWYKDRIDQRGPVSPEATGDEFVSTYSGRGVTIYILDTGLYVEHMEFEGRAQKGRVFAQEYFGNSDEDLNGHGTHCAALAGGKTFGTATDSRIIGVKVLNQRGFGHVESIINGIAWAVDHAHGVTGVISLSLGTFLNPALDMAAEAAGASMIVVVAAGNENENACRHSPGAVGGLLGKNGVVTVGATNNLDRRSNFSNYGKCVDIWAPGTEITSASIANRTATSILDGTSMACPIVAGVVATFLEKNNFDQAAAIAEFMHLSIRKKLKGLKTARNRFVQTLRSTQAPTVASQHEEPTAFPTHAPTVLCVNSFCLKVEFSVFGPFLPVAENLQGVLVVARSNLCKKTSQKLRKSIVLVRRGGCPSFDKVYNGQSAGAMAVIIVRAQGTYPKQPEMTFYERRRVAIHSFFVNVQNGKRLMNHPGEIVSIGAKRRAHAANIGEHGCQRLGVEDCKDRRECQWRRKRVGGVLRKLCLRLEKDDQD